MVPSSDYLGAVRALCTERNALLMLDEVQTGLGRTGHWFAFQAQGLEPDVVTMAKALGNGMPVGACWARAEVAAAFGPGDHGSTFGGQPLALGGGPGHAGRHGGRGRLWPRPCGRGAPGRSVGPSSRCRVVRGAGLLLAAQLEAPRCQGGDGDRPGTGLLVNAVRSDAVRVAPPLLVSADEIDRALAILGAALAEVLPDTETETTADGTPADPPDTAGEWTGPVPNLHRHRRPRSGRLGPGPRARARVAAGAAPRGSGCGAGVREAVGADAQFRARWRSSTSAATPSTSRAPRSASTRGSPPRTWPARSPVTTGSCARAVFDHGVLARMAAALERSGFDVPAGEPALRRRPPVPGGRRRADHARGPRPLAGRALAYVGDANNVARSLAKAGLLEGMEVRIAVARRATRSRPRSSPSAGVRGRGRARRALSG